MRKRGRDLEPVDGHHGDGDLHLVPAELLLRVLPTALPCLSLLASASSRLQIEQEVERETEGGGKGGATRKAEWGGGGGWERGKRRKKGRRENDI